MSLELPRIKGRAAGACHGPPGRPKLTGTIDEEGRIRIDCDNYPEHWQEIQLPSQWVLAYQAHQEDLSDRLSPVTPSAGPADCGARIQKSNLDPFSHLVLRKTVAVAPPKPRVAWDSGNGICSRRTSSLAPSFAASSSRSHGHSETCVLHFAPPTANSTIKSS